VDLRIGENRLESLERADAAPALTHPGLPTPTR
jgi:hypothetical protein